MIALRRHYTASTQKIIAQAARTFCVDGSGIKVTGNGVAFIKQNRGALCVWLSKSGKRKLPEQMEGLMSKPQNHHIEIRDELVSTRTAEHH